MEPKFKVGDRVVVWREWHEGVSAFDPDGHMAKKMGQDFVIKECRLNADGNLCYVFRDVTRWFWPEQCLMLACPNWKVHAIAELICEGE